MSLKNIAIAIIGLGLAIFVGGGGLPVRGFIQSFRLYREYKELKISGNKPSLDQQGSYYAFMYYIAGFSLMFCGGVILLISYLIGE